MKAPAKSRRRATGHARETSARGQRRKERLVKKERSVLRALCQGTGESSVLVRGAVLLAHYRFHEPLHQLLFDALGELTRAEPQQIRELLPARLNNKGFPDVDLEPFFEPHHLTAEQVLALMRELRDSA